MKFLLLLVMLTACAASPQDLSGKMFTFPQPTSRAYVRLTTSTHDLSTVTVCHRSFTDLTRDHVLFSLATPSNDNAFLVFWDAAKKEMEVHVKDRAAEFVGKDYKLNMWHSFCTTWDSTTGLAQLWLDGQPSVRKFTSSGSGIGGPLIILLGQEQDSHGGGFDVNQSFVGMTTDVHMWDHILSPCEIHKYMDSLNFTPGNVLNWRALEFQIFDRVLIEDQIMSCH
uniref:C-reactive protein-like n=1 Tax=Semicossyphus pulcher TaxID=241346 RepID=UPI0037E90697